MRRAILVIAIGVLLGLAIVWAFISQSPPQRDIPAEAGIRRPNLPAR